MSPGTPRRFPASPGAARLATAVIFMLIDTADTRYGGTPDPDDERERRWKPLGMRVLLPAGASWMCLIVGAITPPLLTLALDIAAIVFCAIFVRAMWPRREPRDGPTPPP
jgi:hypothetical protein